MSAVTTISGLYEAFGRADIPAVLGGMARAIQWYRAEGNPYMPSGEPFVGPDAVLNELFMKLGADWDAFQVHPSTYHDAGDVVVHVFRPEVREFYKVEAMWGITTPDTGHGGFVAQ